MLVGQDTVPVALQLAMVSCNLYRLIQQVIFFYVYPVDLLKNKVLILFDLTSGTSNHLFYPENISILAFY